MARARDPAYDKAKRLYLDSKGEMKLIDIAEEVGKSPEQIRKWKSTKKWDAELKGNVTNETKSNVTNKKGAQAKRKSAATESNTNDDEMIDLRMDEPGESDGELTIDGDFNDKQLLFISYYVKYWNATKAYKKAYSCSYNTAMVEGSKHLRNPKIRDEIVRLRDALSESALLHRRTLLQKWIDIAFADITDFVEFGNEQEVVRDFETGDVVLDANGNPKMRTYSYVHLKEDAEVDGTILTSVTLGKDGVGVKLADKMKALEYLSKHMDLLSDNEKTRFENEKRKTNAAIDKTIEETKKLRKQNEAGDQESTEQKLAQLFTMLQEDFKDGE